MKHLVNSLKFDLRCRSEEQAFALRRRITEQLQPLLAEVIDEVCGTYVKAGEQIRIDRLELDLGSLVNNTLDEQLAPQLRQQLEARLLEQLQAHAGMIGTEPAVKDDALQLFVHFMLTGQLPWWAAPEDQDLETLYAELIEHQPQQLIAFFYRHAAVKHIWERVIRQTDDNFREFLLDAIPVFRKVREVVPGITGAIRQILIQSSPQAFEQAAPAAPGLVSDTPVHGKPAWNADHPVIKALLQELQVSWQDDHTFLLEHAPEIMGLNDPQQVWRTVMNLILERLFPKGNAERVAPKTVVIKALSTTPEQLQQDIAAPVHQPEQAAEPAVDTPEVSLPAKMMIHDAGLVLLGPYLKPLFTTLGFWQDGDWQSVEAQEKAACLCSFIATGRNPEREYNLVLGKLLCGIPLHQPVYTHYEFTEEEIKETTGLLEAVIAHWKALKNTSVEGFRTTFLQRDAVLFKKEEDWQLVVEKKTLDVLLESIPWGYGTLALSWNTYLIFTEW